jgi:hypothetical protein
MSAETDNGPTVVVIVVAVTATAASISIDCVNVVAPAVPVTVKSASYVVAEAAEPLSSYDTEADPLRAIAPIAEVDATAVVANSAINFFILFSI